MKRGPKFNDPNALRNPQVLARWICRQLGVRKLRGTSIAPPNSVDGAVLGRTVTLRATFHYQGTLPVDGVMLTLDGKAYVMGETPDGEKQWVPMSETQPLGHYHVKIKHRKNQKEAYAYLPTHPFNGTGHDATLNALPVDLERVCVYSKCVTQYDNRSGHRLSAASNVAHNYHAYRDTDQTYYTAQTALGGLPYAFVEFGPNQSTETRVFALKTAFRMRTESGRKINYHYLNPGFIATMRFITPENLHHAIRSIPREIAEQIGCAIANDQVIGYWQSVCDARIRLDWHARHETDASGGDNVQDMDTSPDDTDTGAECAYAEGLFSGDAKGTFGTRGVLDDDDPYPGPVQPHDRQLAASLKPDDKPVREWYIVARKHPLAWGMENMYSNQREDYGYKTKELRVMPAKKSRTPSHDTPEYYYDERVLNGVVSVPDWAPHIYCHLVSDVQLENIVRDFKSTFMDRVDLRDIHKVGFIVGPYRRQQCHVYRTLPDGTDEAVFDDAGEHVTQPLQNIDLKFNVTLQYMVWPQLPDDMVITPQLRGDFPSLQDWTTRPFAPIDDELKVDRTKRQIQ